MGRKWNKMTGDDILSFITTGEIQGIRTGMTINEVKEKLGQPEKVIGDSKAGYLMYGIVRVGYWGDSVDELALIFNKHTDITISLDYKDDEVYFEISARSKINEVIRLLNYKEINWDCYNKGDTDYFIIRSVIKAAIIFDLYDGSLFMISYMQRAI